MRIFVLITVASVAIGFGLVTGFRLAATPPASQPTNLTRSEVEEMLTSLSNWGRWGKDDQLGALNLITPEKRRQAMALAKTGTVVSLERKSPPVRRRASPGAPVNAEKLEPGKSRPDWTVWPGEACSVTTPDRQGGRAPRPEELI